MSQPSASEQSTLDLDPHHGTMPPAEVLAVLPEGEAATVAQMLARLCPPRAEGACGAEMSALIQGIGASCAAGKLKNALREMVHAGTLCQFPPGRDLDSAAFWRPGDVFGEAGAIGLAMGREAAALMAVAQRLGPLRERERACYASLSTPKGFRAGTALGNQHVLLSDALEALEKFR